MDTPNPGRIETKAEVGVTATTDPLDEKWLEAFYKECGREVTLAYTTLNQMKNWAMTVVAAAITGLSFGNSGTNYPNKFMFIGVVLVYVLVLRFYIRAILCYINLTRWNRLQSDCIQLKLVPRLDPGKAAKSKTELQDQLTLDIQNYYYKWLSTIDRKTQLLSNLKLGFGLIFAVVLFFLLWGLSNLWTDRLVKALFIFSAGTTIVEFWDFFQSTFFDTVQSFEKKRQRWRDKEIFPVPNRRDWYVPAWMFVILVSLIIAEWPRIIDFFKNLGCR